MILDLCIFFNKLIYKILAKRICVLLNKIPSPNQTSFIKDRAISNNILLAQELVHYLDFKVRGGNLLFKINISKAYYNII